MMADATIPKADELKTAEIGSNLIVSATNKKRHRPRTKALRSQLKIELEKAILSNAQLLDELFTKQEDGTLAAPIPAIFPRLGLDKECCAKFARLSPTALKSITKIARTFRIVERLGDKERDGGNQQPHLWLVIKPNQCTSSDERTVFVDNLPAQCTRVKLERRCAQVGAVINIQFPQIPRIQRRIAQIVGGKWPEHSGFGFVQFASKTAAKRFCKRYATNSRLKRSHHHPHGQKHHANKRNRIAQQQGQNQDAQAVDSAENSTMEIEVQDGHEGNLKNNQEAKQIVEENEVEDLLIGEGIAATSAKSPAFAAPLAPAQMQQQQTKITTTSSNLTSISSDGDDGSGAVRVRCYSVAESTMSVDESGRETDFEEKAVEGKDEDKKKKKRNRRKRRPSRLAGTSLNNLFRHIQVFSMRQYKELRANYLKLKKTRMAALKKQLNGNEDATKNEEKREIPASKTSQKSDKMRVGKRVRKRGMRRLMDRAEKEKIKASQQD